MKTIQKPFPELAKALGVTEVWLKREDEHQYLSHKGRSIPLMIKEYVKREGVRSFVISSSGNAALAAAIAVQKHNQNNPDKNVTLRIFVGKKVDAQKLKKLQEYANDAITIEQVENPKQQAFQLEKDGQAKFLRQSTDEVALRGYFELAQELDKIPGIQAIFLPTSSGTTAQAIGESFLQEKFQHKPQIHVVQTPTCHPIVAEILETSTPITDEASLASAICDNVAHRKAVVANIVKSSAGSGWIVSNEEIKDAIALVKKHTNITISPNSALAVAALKKAKETGWTWDGAVACIITGA